MGQNLPDTLQPDEISDLAAAEATIERAMSAAGKVAGEALRRIRDQRLYRATHRSFEAYCIERWGISRAAGYRMIETARERALPAPKAAKPQVDLSQPRDKPMSDRAAARRPKARRRGPEPAPDLVSNPPEAAPAPARTTSGRQRTDRQLAAGVVAAVEPLNPAALGPAFTLEELTFLTRWTRQAADAFNAKRGTTTPEPAATRLVTGGRPPARPARHDPTCRCYICKPPTP